MKKLFSIEKTTGKFNNKVVIEMLNLTKTIEDEIVKRCKRIKGVKKVVPSVKITRTNRDCIMDIDVTVEIEKGLVNKANKNLIHTLIKEEIENIIKEYIPTKYNIRIR